MESKGGEIGTAAEKAGLDATSLRQIDGGWHLDITPAQVEYGYVSILRDWLPLDVTASVGPDGITLHERTTKAAPKGLCPRCHSYCYGDCRS